MVVKTLKAITLTVLSISSVLLFPAALARGQSQSQYDKGTPPQHAVGVSALGSYTSTELGTINLSNGALNFKIPMGSIGGRGGISLPITLNYSSKVWSASRDTDYDRFFSQQAVAYADYDAALSQGGSLQTMIGAGWTIGTGPSIEAKRVLIGKILSGPNAGCYSYTLTKLTLYLPDRGEIELRDDATNGAPLSSVCTNPASRGTRWHATDGSGVIFINDVDNGVAQWPAPNYSGVVVTADGTRIRFGANGAITDRNGNKIVGLTDQLGRTTTIQANVSDPEYPYGPLAWLVTIPGYQGQNRYYKIKKGIMNANYRSGINPALPVITGDWDPEGWGYDWWGSPTRLFVKSYGLYAQRIDDLEVLTELVLPDGRSLKFKYNQFGEVAEVEFPTGGKVQYDYGYAGALPTGNSPLWETGTGGTGTGITTDVKQVDRAVKEKRTYPDGVTLEGRWNYGYAGSNSSVSARSGSNVLLSDEVHYFLTGSRYTEYPYAPGNHDGSHYSLWSTGVEWRTETRNASGAVLAATEQDWTQRTPVSWVGYPTEQPAQDNRVNQHRKYLDTGAYAKVETIYDQHNNPTEVKEYDFDQSLKRRTVTSYVTTNNGYNYATDDAIHLLRLPSQQSVYDAGGTEQARTVYEYDNYVSDGLHAPIVDYGSVTQHDSAYGPGKLTRGNLTAVGNWLNTTGSTLYSYMRYDKVGNVVSTTDPRGNVSTVSFTDDFGNGSNPGSGVGGTYGATYALPTLITSPPPTPGAPVHTARSQYDFSTGLLTGFKDRNDIVAQTIYNDPFNRPTLVKSALGVSGVETHAAMYYAPATAYGITLAKNDVLTARDQTSLDDAVLRSWTVTDGLGRTKETWSRDPQGDVKVITNYDGLGRASQTSNPFRPSQGESAVYTTTAYDLAGRVTSVTTPDNAVVNTSYSGNTVTVMDQAGKARKSVMDSLGRLTSVYEDPNSLNYLTSYTYDVLDNLTAVSQGVQTRAFVYDSLKRLTSATNPESGTIGYLYDNNGNLTQKTDARGIITAYEYDALNRNTTKNYSDVTPDVTYTYDAAGVTNSKGRLTSVSSSVSTSNYTAYNALGLPTAGNQITDGQTYSMSYGYNLAGHQTSMTYPSGRMIETRYDVAGRMAGVRDQQSGIYYAGAVDSDATNRIQYAPHGAVKVMKLGNGLWEHTDFNNRLQPTQIGLGTSSTDSSTLGLTYNYGTTNNNGNLQTISYAGGGLSYTQTFGYDELNRLTTSAESGSSWSQTNSYDRYGNRSVVGGGLSFNANNNRITNSGYVYDAAGNLSNDGVHSYGFDGENKINSVDGVSDVYRYDGDGNRVRKNFAAGEKVRMVYSGGQLIAEYDLSSGALQKEYVYGAKGLIATIEPANGTRYTTSDHLGSPRVVTNASAGVVSRHDYLPFGEEIGAGIGGRTTGMGFSVADGVRQKFTSKERDNETGLDYFLARSYSSAQGRFTSPDEFKGGPEQLFYFDQTAKDNPTFYAELEEPQTLNKYHYAINNPLRYVDPDGHQAVADALRQAQRSGIPQVQRAAVIIEGAVALWGILSRGNNTAGDPSCPACGRSYEMGQALMKRNEQSPAAGQQSQQQGQGQSNTASPNPNDNDKKPRSEGPVFKTNSEAAKQAKELGFTKIGERVHGQAVFKKGNQYITRDVDGHSGGAWKVANSVKDLRTKASRLGTYDKDLKKVAN